jgi:hypothetical protein
MRKHILSVKYDTVASSEPGGFCSDNKTKVSEKIGEADS